MVSRATSSRIVEISSSRAIRLTDMACNLKNASSVKSAGELWLRKFAKYVIQGEFSDSEGAKAV